MEDWLAARVLNLLGFALPEPAATVAYDSLR